MEHQRSAPRPDPSRRGPGGVVERWLFVVTSLMREKLRVMRWNLPFQAAPPSGCGLLQAASAVLHQKNVIVALSVGARNNKRRQDQKTKKKKKRRRVLKRTPPHRGILTLLSTPALFFFLSLSLTSPGKHRFSKMPL